MNRKERLEHLISAIPSLSDFSLSLVDNIVLVLEQPKTFNRLPDSNLISEQILNDFGDILRVHHSFSREPFSKDKFEYALEKILSESGLSATLAPRGQRGYDITINEERFSLKTEAAKAIKENILHISKFMELGGGKWGAKKSDLEGLRQQFLGTLSSFDRILTLRALKKENPYKYELVEIPKSLLSKADSGELEMKMSSSQFPRPGYCHVKDGKHLLYSLYFDGGGERKLQIKLLQKEFCVIHATWEFQLTK